MFSGETLIELVKCLKERGAFLWHACQYVDFCTYVRVGGIPSRSLLEQRQLPFTAFQTDARDKVNGVWTKVFCNLNDFGSTFARGGKATPNAYGPIMLRIHPDALQSATDVAICLRSAGGKGFDRTRESLSTVAEVESLFVHPRDSPYPGHFLKAKSALRERWPKADTLEVSCTVDQDVLSLNEYYVIVDPYVVAGHDLYNVVRQ